MGRGRRGVGVGEMGWIVCERRRANRVFDPVYLARSDNWVKSCSIVFDRFRSREWRILEIEGRETIFIYI